MTLRRNNFGNGLLIGEDWLSGIYDGPIVKSVTLWRNNFGNGPLINEDNEAKSARSGNA